MKCKIIQQIEFEIDIDEYDEDKVDKIVEKVKIIDTENIASNIKRHEFFETKMYDSEGYELTKTVVMEGEEKFKYKFYEPLCKYGYSDCICDPAYIKTTYPEWYKELGCPTTCKQCEDGDCYDDEDK